MMRDGKRLRPSESLATIRQRTCEQLAKLPPPLRELNQRAGFDVQIGHSIRQLAESLDAKRPCK
jgi:hypothetical protein